MPPRLTADSPLPACFFSGKRNDLTSSFLSPSPAPSAKVSADGMSCVCDKQSRIVSRLSDISYYDPSIYAPIVCAACPSDQIPSHDRMFCVDPPQTAEQDDAGGGGAEACAGAEIEQRLNGEPVSEKVCIKCAATDEGTTAAVYSAGFHPAAGSDGKEACVVCTSPHSSDLDGDGECECDAGYRMSNGRCFLIESVQPAYDNQIKLPDGGAAIASRIIAELLPAAYASCFYSVRNQSIDGTGGADPADGAANVGDDDGAQPQTPAPTTSPTTTPTNNPPGGDPGDDDGPAPAPAPSNPNAAPAPTAPTINPSIPNNETACQVLANLCVLQQYRRVDTNACDNYLSLMQNQLVIKKTSGTNNRGAPIVITAESFEFAGNQNGIAEWPVET